MNVFLISVLLLNGCGIAVPIATSAVSSVVYTEVMNTIGDRSECARTALQIRDEHVRQNALRQCQTEQNTLTTNQSSESNSECTAHSQRELSFSRIACESRQGVQRITDGFRSVLP